MNYKFAVVIPPAYMAIAASSHISVFDHAFLNAAGLSLQDTGYAASSRKPFVMDKRILCPFRNDFFIVSFIDEGWLRMRVNLLEYTMTKGHLMILLPQTVFEMVEASPDLVSSSLLVDRNFMSTSGLHANGKEVTDFMAAEHTMLQLSSEECNVLNALLCVMGHESAQSDAPLLRKDIARHSFLCFMLELITLYRRNRVEMKPKISRKEELTLHFIQLVSATFSQERGVQYYADQLFVTAKHLSSSIKEVTGKAPGTFIDDAVIAEAKILLTNPAATVAEIAETLNFSDQSFFGKYFKKHTGYSPSDYRQQYWAS